MSTYELQFEYFIPCVGRTQIEAACLDEAIAKSKALNVRALDYRLDLNEATDFRLRAVKDLDSSDEAEVEYPNDGTLGWVEADLTDTWVSQKVSVSRSSCHGPQHALYVAVKRGQLAGVRAAIAQGAGVDGICACQALFGLTPLCVAATHKRHAVAKVLLDHGAQPNAGQDHTPLHIACSLGDSPMVRLLLERGADPNHMTRNGLVPLHGCTPSVAHLLLEAGATIELSHCWHTPLDTAAQQGDLALVRVLVEQGPVSKQLIERARDAGEGEVAEYLTSVLHARSLQETSPQVKRNKAAARRL